MTKLLIEKKLELQDLFFKYAFCSNCNNMKNNCKCQIMDPIMRLSQFEKAINDFNNKRRAEAEKRIDERIAHINKTYLNDDIIILRPEYNIVKQIIKDIYG